MRLALLSLNEPLSRFNDRCWFVGYRSIVMAARQLDIACPKCGYVRRATDTAPMFPAISLPLFGVLKTVADISMHVAEHAQLKKTSTSITF